MEEQVVSWAPIFGRWVFENDSATYIGPEEESPGPFGIALSNIRIEQGSVEAQVTFSSAEADSGKILLGYRSPSSKYVAAGLGGYNRAYGITQYEPGVGWRGLEVAGSRSNVQKGRQYKLEVGLHGQRVTVAVDGIRTLEHILSEPLVGDQTGLFAWGRASVTFSGIQVLKELPTAFVIMQFSEPYTYLYDDVIRPTAERKGLRAYPVSRVYGPGLILQDIVQGIVESKVVIAEITPPNPNVFYELGYAHALKKPTILLADRGQKLPFDVGGYRCIFYDNSIHGKKDVEDNLEKHLGAILGE